MTWSPEADLEAVLADAQSVGLGVEVVYDGQTVNGVWDEAPGEFAGVEGMRAGEAVRAVLIPAGSIIGLTRNTPIAVGGTSYTIRKVGPGDAPDGALTRLLLVTV